MHLKKAFAGMRALDITPITFVTIRSIRHKEKASKSNVDRETSAHAQAFRIAVKSCLLTVVPPFPNRLKECAPRQGFFEHAEYLAVRGASDAGGVSGHPGLRLLLWLATRRGNCR